jgi:hypothetical protein
LLVKQTKPSNLVEEFLTGQGHPKFLFLQVPGVPGIKCHPQKEILQINPESRPHRTIWGPLETDVETISAGVVEGVLDHPLPELQIHGVLLII